MSRQDIGLLMKDYAEKKSFYVNDGKNSFQVFFENGTLITPLILFYLDSGLVC